MPFLKAATPLPQVPISRKELLVFLFAFALGLFAISVYLYGAAYAHTKALDALDSNELGAARTYALIAARLGSNEAAALVGTMYLRGQGGAVDGENAVYWLERAADGGNVASESILGLMYTTGQGVPKSGEKARFWLLRAANHGDLTSRSLLDKLSQSPGSI